MKEKEYSFQIENIEAVLKYLKFNNYEIIKEEEQKRFVYENNTNINLRKTVINNNLYLLDFKEKKNNLNKNYNEKLESMPLTIDENEVDNIESIIKIFDYKLAAEMERSRVVYEKENIIFEVDNYTKPQKAFVVAFEGEKNQIDKVYEEMKNKNIFN